MRRKISQFDKKNSRVSKTTFYRQLRARLNNQVNNEETSDIHTSVESEESVESVENVEMLENLEIIEREEPENQAHNLNYAEDSIEENQSSPDLQELSRLDGDSLLAAVISLFFSGRFTKSALNNMLCLLRLIRPDLSIPRSFLMMQKRFLSITNDTCSSTLILFCFECQAKKYVDCRKKAKDCPDCNKK